MPRLRALAALAALVAGGGTWAIAGPEDGAAPSGAGGGGDPGASASVSVRVGERVEFAADPEAERRRRWQLDGATVATGPTWTFAPAAADVGRHVVLLDVSGPAGNRRRGAGTCA